MSLCALTHAVPVVVTLVKSEGIFIELVKYSDCCVPSLPRVYNMSGDRDSMTIRFVFHKGTQTHFTSAWSKMSLKCLP